MTVPAATSATGPVATLPAGDTATASTSNQNVAALNGVNADTFLQLLVSELQNQDPDNPTDPTQFLTQTAEFEEVEELNAVQTSVSSMVTAQQSSSATSMLGLQVNGTDATGASVSGIVTGVTLTSTGPMLSVGNATVPYSGITSVTLPTGNASSDDPAASDTTGTSNTQESTSGTNPSATSATAPSSSSFNPTGSD
ncbi:MAG TPA: flagellar hook capping FlgD N-terminal domain-containing protein [Acidimicrobiales bacterium]|nr:flagellar hook capping FlgD N-terminal domain-containing protein [Acidimicrobiales bacterium]